jgi:hypothetical protein
MFKFKKLRQILEATISPSHTTEEGKRLLFCPLYSKLL